MANSEACQVWIDQRIEEEQEIGTPHAEIGRIVGQEIMKYFKVKIEARSLEQQSRRASATTVATPKPPKKQTKPDTKSQLEEVAKEIAVGNVSDDDTKMVGDAIAKAITTGKSSTRVGSRVETAVKKKRKTSAKGGITKNNKTRVEKLANLTTTFMDELTFLADGEIQPEGEDDQAYFQVIRKAGPNIITQYARLGINVVKAAEFAISGEGVTNVEELESANVDNRPGEVD